MTTLIQYPTQLDVLKNIQAEEFTKGQCLDYQGATNVETFFKLKLNFQGQLSHVTTHISSGKYLYEKATKISLVNKDGDILTFGFHNNKISLLLKGKEEEVNFTPDGNPQAYENVLESLYLQKHDVFVSPAIAIEALRIITPVLNHDVMLFKYQKGWNPN